MKIYSLSQIETLASLDKYFSETPESTILTEIEAVSEMDFVGSSAKDYFKTGELTAEEQTEMERYMTLEHIVRLAKAKVLQKMNAHAA